MDKSHASVGCERLESVLGVHSLSHTDKRAAYHSPCVRGAPSAIRKHCVCAAQLSLSIAVPDAAGTTCASAADTARSAQKQKHTTAAPAHWRAHMLFCVLVLLFVGPSRALQQQQKKKQTQARRRVGLRG